MAITNENKFCSSTSCMRWMKSDFSCKNIGNMVLNVLSFHIVHEVNTEKLRPWVLLFSYVADHKWSETYSPRRPNNYYILRRVRQENVKVEIPRHSHALRNYFSYLKTLNFKVLFSCLPIETSNHKLNCQAKYPQVKITPDTIHVCTVA